RPKHNLLEWVIMRLRLLFIPLFLAAFIRAAEPPCGAAGLHVSSVDQHLEAYWCGAAPGMSAGLVEFKSFIQNSGKHTLLITVAERDKAGREVSVNVRGQKLEISVR